MSLDRDISLLRRTALFSELTDDQLRLIAFSAVKHELSIGHELFRRGDAAASGYVVAWGAIDMVEGDGAARTVLASCEASTLIGEMALFVETTRPATAVVARQAGVIEISRALVLRMLNEYPLVAVALRRRLASRLGGTIAEVQQVRRMLGEN